MGKIKDFFTKIGVTDSEAEDMELTDNMQDDKKTEAPAREEQLPPKQSVKEAAAGSYDEKRPEQHANAFGRSSKVVNIGATSGSIREGNAYTGPHSASSQANNMKVVVIQPRSLDDSQQIANCLKEKRPVVINFEGVDDQLYRRILDFVSGTTYALDGSVNSISSRVWLFSPKNVNVSVSKQGNTTQGDMPWEKKQ